MDKSNSLDCYQAGFPYSFNKDTIASLKHVMISDFAALFTSNAFLLNNHLFFSFLRDQHNLSGVILT